MTGNKHQDYATQPYDSPEADQAERRAMLKQDEQARTYFEMAQGDLDDAPGRTPVTGVSAFGPMLPGPAWSRDLAALPPERPLGERVDDLVDMETCWWEPEAIGPKGARDGEA